MKNEVRIIDKLVYITLIMLLTFWFRKGADYKLAPDGVKDVSEINYKYFN